MSDSLDVAVQALRDARRVVVLTGAGVSTASGLPQFRGAGGVWGDRDLMDAHDVDALPGSLDVLWATWGPLRAVVASARPNDAHRAIASLGDRLPGAVTVATQNVDGLHQRAGSREVAELHGSLFRSRCTACEQSFPDEVVPDGIPSKSVLRSTGTSRPDAVP